MLQGDILVDIALGSVLLLSLYTDIKERKIYNKFILSGIVAALVLHSLMQGWPGGALFVIKGFFTGTGLLFLPFAFGGMGAGDVKLLAVVGALKGIEFVFAVFLVSALLGGLFALILLVKQKRTFSTLKNMLYSLYVFFVSGFKVNSLPSYSESPQRFSIPYAPAVAAGVLIIYIEEFFPLKSVIIEASFVALPQALLSCLV